MYDQDLDTTFNVNDGNLQSFSGRGCGCFFIGDHPLGNTEDDEPYLICEESIGMIVDNQQPEAMEVVYQKSAV